MIEIVTPTQTKRLDRWARRCVCTYMWCGDWDSHAPNDRTRELCFTSQLHMCQCCNIRTQESLSSLYSPQWARAHSVNWKTLRLVRAHRKTLISRVVRMLATKRASIQHRHTQRALIVLLWQCKKLVQSVQVATYNPRDCAVAHICKWLCFCHLRLFLCQARAMVNRKLRVSIGQRVISHVHILLEHRDLYAADHANWVGKLCVCRLYAAPGDLKGRKITDNRSNMRTIATVWPTIPCYFLLFVQSRVYHDCGLWRYTQLQTRMREFQVNISSDVCVSIIDLSRERARVAMFSK